MVSRQKRATSIRQCSTSYSSLIATQIEGKEVDLARTSFSHVFFRTFNPITITPLKAVGRQHFDDDLEVEAFVSKWLMI